MSKHISRTLFKGYCGNNLSWKLTVTYLNKRYKLIFELFKRTTPLEVNLQGPRKPRVLLRTHEVYYNHLKNFKPEFCPCPELAEKFLIHLKTLDLE